MVLLGECYVGRPGADIYDLVFLCMDRRAIHHVLLTWLCY